MSSNNPRNIEVSISSQPVQVSLTDKLGTMFSILSIAMSSIAIAFSGYTFYHLELREGHLEIIPPSRVAWVRLGKNDQIHGRDKSDVLLVSFVIHNNGNKLRAIKSVELSLDHGSKQYQLKAIGKFEKLKDITYFTERALEGRVGKDEKGNPIPDYQYSLITSLPIEGNEYYTADLLFLIENESDNNFLLLDQNLQYTGKIRINSYLQKKKDDSITCFKFKPSIIYERVMVSTSQDLACKSSEG